MRLLSAIAVGGAAAWSAVALVQTAAAQTASAPVVSRPVVQAVPGAGKARLNAALAKLGQNPRDVAALLEAGDAASSIGGFDAAVGFYRRADEIAPSDVRIKAGLARALMLSGDPIAALTVYDAAEKAGATPGLIGSDRGLAYDLVGDNITAQRHYNAALGSDRSDELRMRLALSQAMAGNQIASQSTLHPLLEKQDKPGWRTRAFALAIGGDVAQAVTLAETILPPQLADSIAPYLRYMPRLTKAQQAAAANLGRFPRASEIGHDDPRIASYLPPRYAAADSALVPKGEPLDHGKKGRGSATRTARADKAAERPADSRARGMGGSGASDATRKAALAAAEPVRTAPPEIKPSIETTGELPPVRQSMAALAPTPTPSPTPSTTAAPAPAPVAAVSARAALPSATPPLEPRVPAPQPATTPAVRSAETRSAQATPSRSTPASPGFDLARLPASQTASAPVPPPSAAAPQPVAASEVAPPVPMPSPSLASTTAPATAEPAPSRASFADLFSDFGKPTVEALPENGAVDIRTIAAAPRQPVRPVVPTADTVKATDKGKPGDKTKADEKSKAAEKAKADEKAKSKKPAPPAHPSRIWVQIGVGRDRAAIAFDWRRYVKQAPALFKGRQAYVSEMGRTNRILAGPFASAKAANDFIAGLKKADIDGAVLWNSPAGQVVDELSAK